MQRFAVWQKVCAYILIVSLVVGLCPNVVYGEESSSTYDEEVSNDSDKVLNEEPEEIEEEATILCELKNKRT